MAKELDAVMRPKSIAVIGATERAGSIGKETLSKLLEYGYKGQLYPVNPKADTVSGIKSYKSVKDIPGQVDLALILVRNDFVSSVIDECGEKGIKGLVVITAGFKESSHEGAVMEQEILEKVRKYGMRMVGPNCLGIINTDAEYMMDATFAEALPTAGRIGFVSQSGALGAAILNISKDMNVGLNQFVSIGNNSDINGETMMEYWEDDTDVDQILLYLEAISNPANFRKLASRITKKKPIIAVKSGRSAAGAKAASSHTGALAGADLATEALLKQCGVIRTDSMLELFETASVLTHCPLPKNNRVAIMTNAGGPGIMATDALCAAGLEIAQLSDKTMEILKAELPPAASVKNPVDMIASATIDQYKFTLETLIADENVDMVMVIFLPLMNVNPMDISNAVMEIKAKHPKKPVIGVMMANNEFFDEIVKHHTNIPFFRYPEPAASAMARLDAQRKWVERPVGTEPTYSVDYEKAKTIIKGALEADRDQLTTLESIDVLEAYGIRTCKYAFAVNVDEAANAANQIGYPVVMKITSTKISHKTEVGGVIVGIASEEQLRSEYTALLSRLASYGYSASDLDGVIIQEMVTGSREVVCGIATDPQYGHMMMFGLGGIYLETIKDVAFRIAPLTDIDAEEMIKSVKAYKILMGARGEKAVDIEQIKEIMLRLSQLVKDFSFIKELDINPLKISDKTAEGIAVDGRIQVDMEAAKKAICGCGCNCCSC